jgi:hypothetical protein
MRWRPAPANLSYPNSLNRIASARECLPARMLRFFEALTPETLQAEANISTGSYCTSSASAAFRPRA